MTFNSIKTGNPAGALEQIFTGVQVQSCYSRSWSLSSGLRKVHFQRKDDYKLDFSELTSVFPTAY